MDKEAIVIISIQIVCSLVSFIFLSITNDYDFYYIWLATLSIALLIFISEHFKN